ncbi:hypothetical protein KIN20_011513, partial [Parelaphostrongylus tenuis]
TRRMIRSIDGARLSTLHFTDENIYGRSTSNVQNQRRLFKEGQESAVAETMIRSHFPASVVVWADICATARTPLVFIKKASKSTPPANSS